MQFVSHKKLYLPAVTLIAIVLLLLVVIAVSTFGMLNHQKEKALGFIHSQGEIVLHALASAAVSGTLPSGQTADAVDRLIEELVKRDEVARIYVFDAAGTVSRASPAELKGQAAGWRPALSELAPVAVRIHRTDRGERVMEMAKHLGLQPPLPSEQGSALAGGGRDAAIPTHHADDTVVLSMSLEALEAAHRLDVHHALVMGAILLVLGSAALFFAFVIQNYHLVTKALNRSRDDLGRVMASMPNGILSTDAGGKITSINGPARALLGLETADLRLVDLRSIIDFADLGIDRTLTEGASVIEKEILLEKPNGAVPLAVSAAPLVRDNDQAPNGGAVIILRDLTEIKGLEERVRRSERLAGIGAMAATLAHEVRNPLSSIRGFARFLAQLHRDRPQEREYAELMVNEVDRINKVVTDLLAFAHPAPPKPAPTDVSVLLDHVVRLVEPDAFMRRVAIARKVPPTLPAAAIDGHQITQAMLNLLLNALQAVAHGGKIQVAARVAADGRLELSVADDGAGIAADQREKIFEPFHTTREQGTGLGLAIVRAIVEQHDGEVRIDSPPPGKAGGTLVSIMLPMAAVLPGEAGRRVVQDS